MGNGAIILTGFMGTGKSRVGRLLAAKSGRTFVDTDELIAQRAGKPVAAIFAGDGEPAFRAYEAAVARELAGQSDLVIATGGGMLVDADIAAILAEGNQVFCLVASPAEIVRRLADDDGERPLLTGGDAAERVAALLRQRQEAYARFLQVETDHRTPEEVAAAIAARAALAPITANGAEQVLPVRYPGGSYDVTVGSGLLEQAGAASAGQSVVISDDNVAPLYAARCGVETVLAMPAGESHKRLDTVRRLYDGLLDARLDRSGTIIALGGGVAGDVAGFVAATYLRGVRLIQCPTTLLAMVDASVGGKTGVDLPQGKNLVGAFYQPAAVIADVLTLGTLPPAEVAAGLAEVVKHGLIAEPALLDQLAEQPWLPLPPPEARQQLVAAAIAVKRDVVQEDPFELGRRAVLNLGHTFAHAIEQVSSYAVRHGEAVAIGLVAAAHLSALLGYTTPALQGEIEGLLQHLTLPTRIPSALEPDALLAAMGHDKKRAAGLLRFVLIAAPGEVFVAGDVPDTMVVQTLRALQAEDERRE
jgi:shikimate kinase / 3-dehydroquinate synthase